MKLPRFTLRELFLLVLACAFATAWWADRKKMAAREAAVKHDQETVKQALTDLAKERELVKFHQDSIDETVKAHLREYRAENQYSRPGPD